MGRNRNLHTDISIDEEVAQLSESGLLAPLLYTWAIPHMDDWGRITGNARQFKMLVCPGLDVTSEQVESALQHIADVGLWERYEAEGRPYIAVDHETWFKRQSYINKDKRTDDSKSAIPAPPSWPYSTQGQETPTNAKDTQTPAENPASPSPTPSEEEEDARAREDNDADGYEELTFAVMGTMDEPAAQKLAEHEAALGRPVLIEALKEARDNSTGNPRRYLAKVVLDWEQAGIRDLAALARRRAAFEAAKIRPIRNKSSPAPPPTYSGGQLHDL